MRALFLTGSLPEGGAERHAIGLLNRLADRGHDCHAACVKSSGDGTLDVQLPPRGTLTCIDAVRYLDTRALRRLASHIASLRPQVIVAANPYALMYGALARAISGLRARLVVTFHSTRLLNHKERLQMLAYRPLFWNADCTVFLCRGQQQHWRRRGVFSRHCAVIYNGIDTEVFNDRIDAAARTHLRRGLGCADGDYVIGIPALLRAEKNHLQLLDAVARLRQNGVPARALLIGDGEQRRRIEAHAHRLGISGVVQITGLQRDVRPFIAACDVITLCSVTETFSLAALEAMAMGKPLVLSAVGGAAEMVVPGWNGLLFPVNDTTTYVRRLARLRDPALVHRLGRNARQIAESRFSLHRMVDSYENLLTGICPGAGTA